MTSLSTRFLGQPRLTKPTFKRMYRPYGRIFIQDSIGAPPGGEFAGRQRVEYGLGRRGDFDFADNGGSGTFHFYGNCSPSQVIIVGNETICSGRRAGEYRHGATGPLDGKSRERVVRQTALAGRLELPPGYRDQSIGDVAGRELR